MLPNGIRLQVVEMHAVPLVQARLMIMGGARLDGELPGLATFTAAMLTEGAGERDALALAAEAEYLGASLSSYGSWDEIGIFLDAPKRTFAQSLDLMADVVLRPTFKADDITRQRDLRLTRILQQQDQPAAVASLIFNKVVYPAGHPYHNSMDGDSASTAALDSAMVRDFWGRAASPEQATLIVTGDITLEEAKALATERLGAWQPPARPLSAPTADELPVAPRPATRIILVDKPGAAQSVILIGAPGFLRESGDYPSITLMNTILGGSFSSRLNDILREQKGYTYGAGSRFSWQPLPGPFIASSGVRTNVTDSSLAIFFREFEELRQSLVEPAELERARSYITLGRLGSFETSRQVAAQLANLNTLELPLSTITADLAAIEKLTASEVRDAARAYIDPDHLTVVVVGDIAEIRPGIEALDLGPILIYDHKGDPVQ
jgi:zinc protease